MWSLIILKINKNQIKVLIIYHWKYWHFLVMFCFLSGWAAAWKMPINVTQESYDKVKSIPPPQRRVKRPRLDKSVASGGDSDQENMLENVEVTNLDPPSGDKRPMVLFSHVMKQSELAKVSSLMNHIIYSIICTVSNISIDLYTAAYSKTYWFFKV